MKKITVDLDILVNHALSFEQYLVLLHCHTGEFETTEDQWLIFDEGDFCDKYLSLKKPGTGAVLHSLRHRKFIELKGGGLFRIVNKSLFNTKNSSKKKAPDILSFRKDNVSFLEPKKKVPLLNLCTKLQNFKSEEFKKAAEDFEMMRLDIKEPLTQAKADRMAPRLLRLSGGSEKTAILILRESTENSWIGIHPLKYQGPPPPTPPQDRRNNVDHWYPETAKH